MATVISAPDVDRNRAVGVCLNTSDLIKSRIFDNLVANGEVMVETVRKLVACGIELDKAIAIVKTKLELR